MIELDQLLEQIQKICQRRNISSSDQQAICESVRHLYEKNNPIGADEEETE